MDNYTGGSGAKTEVPDVPDTDLGLVRTNYFAETGGHRDPVQVWAVKVDGVDLTIHIQGPIPSELRKKAGGTGYTYFAKKHILTFKGGKRALAGGSELEKMQAIYDKRVAAGRAHTKLKKTKFKYSPTKDETHWMDGYGGTSLKDVKINTYVCCDLLSPEELKQAFGEGLWGARTNKSPDARIEFGEKCVALYDGISRKLKGVRTFVGVRYVRDQATNTYYIYHCHEQL